MSAAGATKEARLDQEAAVAERIAAALEATNQFKAADWNDLGEVTVWVGGRTYRMTVTDITDEDA
jgi:hypothetical protein